MLEYGYGIVFSYMKEIYVHNNDIFIAWVSLAKQQCSDVLVWIKC